jgi:(p)ppGpp synthase/HD superfamily hydrolase
MTAHDAALRDSLALTCRAADFAARRHAGQHRKGAEHEPFINHLAEVACLLAETAQNPDPHLVAAGWLHDTLEKTGTTEEELQSRFGRLVTAIVVEVTDDPSLPEEERKRLQVTHTAGKSEAARLLKMADKTSNLRARAANAPKGRDPEKLAAYVDWTEQVVASCRGLNAELEKEFDLAVAVAREAIERGRSAG